MKKLKKMNSSLTAAYVAKIAILSAFAFVLYMFCKFNLPFMFPGFLDMQFSEFPAILAGFSMGPIAGALVILIKCLIKFPFSSTAFVGEIMDMILGLFYVVPASIIYKRNKTRKNALIGLIIGTVIATLSAMLFNRIVAIPFYVKNLFGGNFGAIVGMCSSLYPNLTVDNFYWFYIFVAVLPFNLLRLGLVSCLTFFIYKRISKLLHWEIKSKKKDTRNSEFDNNNMIESPNDNSGNNNKNEQEN